VIVPRAQELAVEQRSWVFGRQRQRLREPSFGDDTFPTPRAQAHALRIKFLRAVPKWPAWNDSIPAVW
jgi:hypothetical protein